jgi:hypothetical protein
VEPGNGARVWCLTWGAGGPGETGLMMGSGKSLSMWSTVGEKPGLGGQRLGDWRPLERLVPSLAVGKSGPLWSSVRELDQRSPWVPLGASHCVPALGAEDAWRKQATAPWRQATGYQHAHSLTHFPLKYNSFIFFPHYESS